MSQPNPKSDSEDDYPYFDMSLFGEPQIGNATPIELTWPIVKPRASLNFLFCDGEPSEGNATAEEKNWPVVRTNTPNGQ
ncbi:MAG: hypothetical protein ACRC8S_08540 [Fimbriiglobus sp.]